MGAAIITVVIAIINAIMSLPESPSPLQGTPRRGESGAEREGLERLDDCAQDELSPRASVQVMKTLPDNLGLMS